MTKTKEREPEAATTGNGHDLEGALSRLARDIPSDLRKTLEPILGDLHKTVDPALQRLEEILERTDLLAVVGERNKVIDDLKGIINSETIPVAEGQCVNCGKQKGEPHARGACAATARLEAARKRIEKA